MCHQKSVQGKLFVNKFQYKNIPWWACNVSALADGLER